MNGRDRMIKEEEQRSLVSLLCLRGPGYGRGEGEGGHCIHTFCILVDSNISVFLLVIHCSIFHSLAVEVKHFPGVSIERGRSIWK